MLRVTVRIPRLGFLKGLQYPQCRFSLAHFAEPFRYRFCGGRLIRVQLNRRYGRGRGGIECLLRQQGPAQSRPAQRKFRILAHGLLKIFDGARHIVLQERLPRNSACLLP